MSPCSNTKRYAMRTAHRSMALLAVMLTPAFLQVDCESGNATLSSLELEVFGQNEIVGFSGSVRSYDVSTSAVTATLRATTVAPGARVTYTLIANTTMGGFVGIGGGAADVPIPVGSSSLLVSVTDGGTNAIYTVNVTAVPSSCGDGVATPPEQCDDGNNDDGDSCSSGCVLQLNPDPVVKTVPLACSQNVTLGVSEVDYELTVDPMGPVVASQPVAVDVSANAILDQTAGLTEIGVIGLHASVAVRSGGTAAEVLLSRSQPFANGRCMVSDAPCSIDADCGGGEVCVDYIPVPTIDGTGDACAACTAIGKSFDCFTYGFCSEGPVAVPVGAAQTTVTPDGSGAVLFGWNEDLLPPVPVPPQPLGPNGASYFATGLIVRLECYMGTANAGGTAGESLPDAELLALPTTEISSIPVCGNQVVELGEECDDGNTADGDGCAGDCTIETISLPISVVCSSNSTSTVFDMDYTLEVDPQGPVVGGGTFDASFTGVAEIPEILFDRVYFFSGSGPTEATIDDLSASVSVRSGATGSDVLLTLDQAPLVTIPTSSDCAPGGVCDSLGKLGTQCASFGRCVTGGVQVPLTQGVGTFTADANGNVLLGWSEGALPPFPVSFGDPVGPIGGRIDGDGVLVGYECSMGEANPGGTAGVLLDDADLVSLSIPN